MFDEIACPVCSSNHTQRIFIIDAHTAGSLVITNNPEQSFRIFRKIEVLWQSNQVEFLSSYNCMFGIIWPFLARIDDKWEYDRAIQIIGIRYISFNSIQLELGAENGSFMDRVSISIEEKCHFLSIENSSAGVEEIWGKGFKCCGNLILVLPYEHLSANCTLVKYFFGNLMMPLLSIRFLPLLIYLLLKGTNTPLFVHLQKKTYI